MSYQQEHCKAICQRCNKIIKFVHIDRQPGAEREPNFCKNWNFSVANNKDALKDQRVMVPIPANALCRNVGDEDFIRECIHCPECHGFPFGRDICDIYADTPVMYVVFNAIDFEHFDEQGNWKPLDKYCAQCNAKIERGAQYYMITDNYLRLNCFSSEEENIFCSEKCVMEWAGVKAFINGEEKVIGSFAL